jgi:hypothetical protein
MNKLAIISLALVSASAFGAKPHVYKGWVGDKACGLKCASVSHKACAVKCLSGGGTYIFILDKDKKTTFTVENPTALKGDEGLLVQVTGTVSGDKIHIDGVKQLKQPAPTMQKAGM